jgi:hypothetical protein
VTDDSSYRDASRRSVASHAPASAREPLLDAVEGCQRLLETQRLDLAALRGRLHTVEAAAASERHARQEQEDVRRQVQVLREDYGRYDRDLRQLFDRVADLEHARAADRHAQHEHLEWIRHLYSRVGALESRAPPSGVAAPAAPAVPGLTQADLAQVMAQALRQILGSSGSPSQPPMDSSSPPPPPGGTA